MFPSISFEKKTKTSGLKLFNYSRILPYIWFILKNVTGHIENLISALFNMRTCERILFVEIAFAIFHKSQFISANVTVDNNLGIYTDKCKILQNTTVCNTEIIYYSVFKEWQNLEKQI